MFVFRSITVLGSKWRTKDNPFRCFVNLGLRVIGQPVVLKLLVPLMSLEQEFGAPVVNRIISVELLKKRLESIGDRDDESFFCYILYRALLFPSANRKVDSRSIKRLVSDSVRPQTVWFTSEWSKNRQNDSDSVRLQTVSDWAIGAQTEYAIYAEAVLMFLSS
ncbi:hypothetical protein QVD17_08795 [Tagetes erecta]|uniref:Uncharacterized protein n=1 Tax=Tagetes erecta TaxID=13708 RepID=A0AAD8L0H2_TARER|nr:hypothetical protein QVD17_08795 [Tagetes erecta]